MKLPLPAVTDADDQQHLFAAADDRVTFPDTVSPRDSPRSRETRRTSAPRRPQPPRTNNLVHSKPEESTKNNCVSSSLVQEFTLVRHGFCQLLRPAVPFEDCLPLLASLSY
ncbi:unnamed protein product [Schistocephalus solidus]|uniref:Uncharacterized protein n=1 Tax=Schistocephalus solidus TaxID=70667 RepID=A0A183SM99_SCHSO|nr:unnamed protein product [Schistocephalus solidus]